MTCGYHPDQSSVTQCAVCLKALCEECYTEKQSFFVCHQCALLDSVNRAIIKKSREKSKTNSASKPYTKKMIKIALFNIGWGVLFDIILFIYIASTFSFMSAPNSLYIVLTELLLIVYFITYFITNGLMSRGFGVARGFFLFIVGVIAAILSGFTFAGAMYFLF